MTRSYQSTNVGEYFPDATIFEDNTTADMLYALTEKKIDTTRKPFVYIYDGKGFNPKDSDNILSLKLAQNAAESILYEAIDNEGYTNLVTVKVK